MRNESLIRITLWKMNSISSLYFMFFHFFSCYKCINYIIVTNSNYILFFLLIINIIYIYIYDKKYFFKGRVSESILVEIFSGEYFFARCCSQKFTKLIEFQRECIYGGILKVRRILSAAGKRDFITFMRQNIMDKIRIALNWRISH